jgi:SlyX protein
MEQEKEPSPAIEARLDKIEIKLAYLEDFLSRLQDETLSRNAQIEELRSEHAAMKNKLFVVSRELEEYPDKRPPHY